MIGSHSMLPQIPGSSPRLTSDVVLIPGSIQFCEPGDIYSLPGNCFGVDRREWTLSVMFKPSPPICGEGLVDVEDADAMA